MKRILVTGSRTWTDRDRLTSALWAAYEDLGMEPTTLVTGACPDGADALAEAFWKLGPHPIELHPIDPYAWKLHGKRAGFLRNLKMVTLGADMCLAFIRGESNGATMTAELAESNGIPTRRFTA